MRWGPGCRALLVVAMDPLTDIHSEADHEALYTQMADVLSTLGLA